VITVAQTQLTEMMSETDAEFIVSEISGGAKARYVRIHFASFYRFEDVTERVMALLELPLVRAEGMHTAAIYGTDAELALRIAEAVHVHETREAQTPASAPQHEGPSGGKRVRSRKPAPTRPPRGGVLTPTK
jgi:hypothetical protein